MATNFFVGSREFFPGIAKIQFEGRKSANPLAFKFYDENKLVGSKTMRDHLRFAACYWHSFLGSGADPFGPGTRPMPWNQNADPVSQAKDRLDAAFEFFTKLGVPYYCFHDRDMSPEGK